MKTADHSLVEQLAYYEARAAEYDQWWLRQGRYDRGAEINARWLHEAAEVDAALADFNPAGRVLELAGGTGIWTRKLARFAVDLTVVDGSPAMLALNARRVDSARVRRVQADLFDWEPDGVHDVVFFGFWLSHVPPDRFDAFWERVRRSLSPGGRCFFVDSLRTAASTAVDHVLPDEARREGGGESVLLQRRLDDGREFRVYKVFHEPAVLRERLAGMGWQVDIRQTNQFFLYGQGTFRDS